MMRVDELIHPGEGDEELSETSRNDPHAGKGKSSARRQRKGEGSSKAGEVGKALRSVYDSTLREEVPNDFLDLLGKLN
jgi:hypothetical protein